MLSLEEMIKEAEELNARRYKLEAFYSSDKFKELETHEQVLLCLQMSHMNLYREVLEERIHIYEQKVRS